MQDHENPANNHTAQDPLSSANHVDTAVGHRIRCRRIEMRVTQTELGNEVGVSFQQIQKYERGSNRVSASALYQIAIALHVPVSFFFDLIPEMALEADRSLNDAVNARLAYLHTREGERLVDLFLRVPPAARRHVLGVMSVLATPSTAQLDDEAE